MILKNSITQILSTIIMCDFFIIPPPGVGTGLNIGDMLLFRDKKIKTFAGRLVAQGSGDAREIISLARNFRQKL